MLLTQVVALFSRLGYSPVMEKSRKAPRFGVYLSDEEARWLNETRGKFLLRYGEDLTVTSIVRAAIQQLRALDEPNLFRILEPHRGRRRGGE